MVWFVYTPWSFPENDDRVKHFIWNERMLHIQMPCFKMMSTWMLIWNGQIWSFHIPWTIFIPVRMVSSVCTPDISVCLFVIFCICPCLQLHWPPATLTMMMRRFVSSAKTTQTKVTGPVTVEALPHLVLGRAETTRMEVSGHYIQYITLIQGCQTGFSPGATCSRFELTWAEPVT